MISTLPASTSIEKVSSHLLERLRPKAETYKPEVLNAFNSIATIEDLDHPLDDDCRATFEASKLMGDSFEQLIERVATLCIEDPDIIQRLNDYISSPEIKIALIESISDLNVPNISIIPEMLLITERDPKVRLEIIKALNSSEAFFSIFSSSLRDKDEEICNEALKKLKTYNLSYLANRYIPEQGKTHHMGWFANSLISVLESNHTDETRKEALNLLKEVVRISIR